jgi:hypothetical protein
VSAGKRALKTNVAHLSDLTKPPVIEIIMGAELFVFFAAQDWLHESESYK